MEGDGEARYGVWSGGGWGWTDWEDGKTAAGPVAIEGVVVVVRLSGTLTPDSDSQGREDTAG